MPMPDVFHELARRVNNWGRWGDDDEIGTINLITPEAVRRAAGCVRRGVSFPLGLPLSDDGPQVGFIPGRVNPQRSMLTVNEPLTDDPAGCRTSDDVVTMGIQASTHWDALAHVSYDGRLYNGFPPSSVSAAGAARCGIDKITRLVGRGVLLDIARARGVERLAPGEAVTADDLDAAEARAGTAVAAGDVVLVRTGHVQLFRAGDRMAYNYPSPGLSLGTVEWFHAHDVAAVATDTLVFEVFPGELDDVMLPVHLLHLVEMGLTQGQNFDLEDLAADCASDGVHEMLLEATPEPFVGGLGGLVNPVAVK